MIEISHLYKTYTVGENKVQALNDVSLTIDEHEFVAIVGPSGSGKTTLMNIIGCLDTATSGSYRLNGMEIGDYDDNGLSGIRNRTIGFVFQKFNLLGKLNALENVELPLVYRGVGGKERLERARRALEMVGLQNRMDHVPFELSGGQQQRVAIARAIITDPPLILADEPTGNLDSRTGAEVLKILHRLNEAGRTVVLITHDPNVAAQAKRVVRIGDGRILSDRGGGTE
ncbi:MAG: ABC transporter ATP-binding protein [Oscillospiraceae bacterium]|nr:ABC transporter ATP-binding protein [Oscillospiraceae bacterium]MCI1990285.1 ABC transporter ATP-binding protein [Oscillospiraceae bacterium]